MQASGRARSSDTGRHHIVAGQPARPDPADDEDTGFGETVFAAPPGDDPGLDDTGHDDDTVIVAVDPAEAATTVLERPQVAPWPNAAARRTRAQERAVQRRRAAHAPLPVDTIVHLLVVAVAWALAIVVTLAIASETKIGPVVVRFTSTHGLHEGDLDTALLMAGLATLVTIGVAIRHVLVRRRRR